MPGPKKNRLGNLPTPSTTESSGETDPTITVISARYRAAWPQLRPLPLEWSTGTASTLPPLLQQRSSEIQHTVLEIIRRYRNNNGDDGDDHEVDVSLVNQQMASQPHTSVPTIAISAPWSESRQGLWKTVIQAIAVKLYYIFKDSDFSYENIHIDMQAPELTQTIYYGPVDNHLVQSWDNVRTLVRQRLELFKSTAGCMTAICLFHYGTLRDINDNPITIYVAVNYSSDETGWLEVIADIKANIQKRGWTDVQVHLEHNIGMSYTFPLLEPKGPDESLLRAEGLSNNMHLHGDYQQIVKPGDDFSASDYITRSDNVLKSSGFGTLGCFVELKTKSVPVWKRYALTNYHTVRPALPGFCLEPVGSLSQTGPPQPGSDCWTVDEKGYFPNSRQKPIPLESPSRAKHNFTIWFIKYEIESCVQEIQKLRIQIQATNDSTEIAKKQAEIIDEQTSIQLAEDEMRKKIDFFDADKHILGTLFAASGYMRRADAGNHKMRLDWALIDVAGHRQGPNCLPLKPAWYKSLSDRRAHPSYTYGKLLKDQSQSIGPGNISSVWKVGANTGPTIGRYHSNRVDCTMAEDRHLESKMSDYATTEYIYQPGYFAGTRKFCARGDSGSVVFDENGGIVGLFFRGHRPNNSLDGGFGLVTPIEHVFKDIIDFSNGGITEIRVAKN
ncbi:hypothetical protein ACHAPY_001310 [Fusarium culmorum]